MLLALLLLDFGLTGCRPPSQESPVLAIVNGRPIQLNEFEYRWTELSETTRARYESEGGKRKFLDDLIARELLMQEARKLGLQKSPRIRQQTQRYQERLLLDEVMIESVKAKVEISQEELESYYISRGAVLPAPDEIEVSQIVSNNIYASKDIRRMLREGVAFSALAKRYSTDPYTREKGGELGLYKKGTAPPEVEEVIYRSRAGMTSDPIKTDSGYYIIRVTSRKPGNTKAILLTRERLKQELYAEKRQKQIEAFLTNLKKTASIRVADASKYLTQPTSSQEDATNP